MKGRMQLGWVAVLAAGCASSDAHQRGTEGAMLDDYTTVRLEADLGPLTDDQRKMIPLLIEAAQVMDALFWRQAWGSKDALLPTIEDPKLRRLAEVNYGPWDRLHGNEPFVPGIGPKPEGARFYPADVTEDELAAAAKAAPDGGDALRGLYTVVRRGSDGTLTAIPYHEQYGPELQRAADLLRQAAALAESEAFRRYLLARADALVTSDYRASDVAWLDMRDNALDLVIGPIETYEDRLLGAKASFEAYVLIVDRDWSQRLQRYATLLPELQKSLPVEDRYKQESPGSDSQLGAYDVVYYAGDCNAGSKTIAINLPNDESVQLEKGTRRLQLKNAMRAKFDRIMLPISERLIAADQRDHVKFDAFFQNTMFHEVAHGLGIKHTLEGERTVREALADEASALEEGKADVLGLWMVEALAGRGELGTIDLHDNAVTFLASIFRSIRFGAASAHGRANLVRFNYFTEQGAFHRGADGTYRVDFDRFDQAVESLSRTILELQGNGDRDAAAAFTQRYGELGSDLRQDLDRLGAAGIPVDVVFEQGADVLGLR